MKKKNCDNIYWYLKFDIIVLFFFNLNFEINLLLNYYVLFYVYISIEVVLWLIFIVCKNV